MDAEGADVGELLVADVAAGQLDAAVDPHVRLQAGAHRERAATLHTLHTRGAHAGVRLSLGSV